MLILGRAVNEKIYIGDEIIIAVDAVVSDCVTFAIQIPKNIRVKILEEYNIYDDNRGNK